MKYYDYGELKLVNHYGSDQMVVDAARVSVDPGEVKRNNEKLINYLMENRHSSPFEHCGATFYVKCPIFIARQWMRHRTQSYNEMSGRYRELPGEFWVPKEIRRQSKTNKQSSDGTLHHYLEDWWTYSYQEAWKNYQGLLDRGVAREQARAVLPVGLMTQFYTTANLWNWLHFISLRLDSHAQEEIQWFGQGILDCLQHKFPVSVDAWIKSR